MSVQCEFRCGTRAVGLHMASELNQVKYCDALYGQLQLAGILGCLLRVVSQPARHPPQHAGRHRLRGPRQFCRDASEVSQHASVRRQQRCACSAHRREFAYQSVPKLRQGRYVKHRGTHAQLHRRHTCGELHNISNNVIIQP